MDFGGAALMPLLVVIVCICAAACCILDVPFAAASAVGRLSHDAINGSAQDAEEVLPVPSKHLMSAAVRSCQCSCSNAAVRATVGDSQISLFWTCSGMAANKLPQEFGEICC